MLHSPLLLASGLLFSGGGKRKGSRGIPVLVKRTMVTGARRWAVEGDLGNCPTLFLRFPATFSRWQCAQLSERAGLECLQPRKRAAVGSPERARVLGALSLHGALCAARPAGTAHRPGSPQTREVPADFAQREESGPGHKQDTGGGGTERTDAVCNPTEVVAARGGKGGSCLSRVQLHDHRVCPRPAWASPTTGAWVGDPGPQAKAELVGQARAAAKSPTLSLLLPQAEQKTRKWMDSISAATPARLRLLNERRSLGK
ncbi:uncharacterized protein LOC116527704 [Sapajus apella]|uniref:Uncharacterized protein LOC116527704 n=1 Tax=Sapajus apella TaxID=9515 RepID=A0A6J3F589_SAPAP|nr:uncharacterized protein LOC116527704 [Sapajus apella]